MVSHLTGGWFEMTVLKSRFGGIWKDGAVEEPVDECYCSDGRLVVLSKASGSLGLFRRLIDPVCWGDWWWLDCRIPKSLLPEEAFDLAKVLYPGVFRIKRGSRTWLTFGGHDRIEIDWGGRIIYPPIEPIQSVNITLENWLMYLHWDCEYGVSYEGGVGKLIGLAERGQFALLVAGGGVAFSSEVRVKVGSDGRSALVVMEPVLDPLVCGQMREKVGLVQVLEAEGKSVLAAEGEKK